MSEEVENDLLEYIEDTENDMDEINAIQKLPCFRKVRMGYCKDEGKGCEYAHEDSVIAPERSAFIKKLQELNKGKVICAFDATKHRDGRERKGNKIGKEHIRGFRKPHKAIKGEEDSNIKEMGRITALLAVKDPDENDETFINQVTELKTKVHVYVDIIGLEKPMRACALLDTGADSCDYVSSEFYYRHLSVLQKFFLPKKSLVGVAGGSLIDLIGVLRVPVVLSSGQMLDLTFKVFESRGGAQDVIIGLRTLLLRCFSYFQDVLVHARSALLAEEAQDIYLLHDVDSSVKVITAEQARNVCRLQDANSTINVMEEEVLLEPFSTTAEEAPEDLEYDHLPVQFAEYLNFMEAGYDQSLNDYVESIDTQCSKEMLTQTSLRELLLDKGKQVFVPTNWEGITDVAIELTWKSTPPRRKPEATPVNERILATAKIFSKL